VAKANGGWVNKRESAKRVAAAQAAVPKSALRERLEHRIQDKDGQVGQATATATLSPLQGLNVVDTSQWFEERSTDADSRPLRRHVNRLLAAMGETAARRQGKDDVLRILRTVPDPEHRDQPANSP
jgi:hypothetical protein